MEHWDQPACPRCKGCGRIVLMGRSWIEIGCADCRGTGAADPPPLAPKTPGFERPPVGEHAAVAESGLCGGCLGAGTVLGAGWRIEPCPHCQDEAA